MVLGTLLDVNKDFKWYRRSAAGAIFYTTYILIGNILAGVNWKSN
jgi:hypothetical protein